MNTSSPRPIRLLPPALRNQIAAGEVVERPASVLKELVENSLDAGASDIAVTIEDGGQTLLAVRDNGHGIPAPDLELAVTRHATSKLSDFNDLLHVASYGFRGEALPSIASVADLRLESAYRPPGGNCEEGAFIHVLHGEIVEKGPSPLPGGTLVSVSDLFASVPARLKFLKTPSTEQKRCQEILLRLALAREDVSFSLIIGKGAGGSGKERELFRLPAALPLRERLGQIWPPQVAESLLPFSGERGGMRVHGLFSPPQASQTRGDRMLLYVNGRPVSDKLLLRAVREAYKGRLTSREYPQIVLFLEIDPQEVDVNVHPAKTEVRFRDERAVFGTVLKTLEASLGDHSPALSSRHDPDDPFAATPRPLFSEKGYQDGAGHAELPPLYAGGNMDRQGNGAGPADQARRPDGFWGSLDKPRLVDLPRNEESASPFSENDAEQKSGMGSLPEYDNKADTGFDPFFTSGRHYAEHRSYGVAEQKSLFAGSDINRNPHGQTEFPDNYDTIESPTEIHSKPIDDFTELPPQERAFPVAVGPFLCLGQVADSYLVLLENDELLLLDQHAAHERVLLHTIERETGSAQSQLLAIPERITLHPAESERLMESYAKLASLGYELGTEEGNVTVRGVPPLLGRARGIEMLRAILTDRTDGIDDLLHLMACHSAIRAGQRMTADEAAGLLRRWMHTPDCEFCPHGRPIVLRFGKNELEKLFKRKIQ